MAGQEDLSAGVFVPVHAEGVLDGEAGPRERHHEVEDGGCSEQEALQKQEDCRAGGQEAESGEGRGAGP